MQRPRVDDGDAAAAGGHGELHAAFHDHQHEIAGIALAEHAGIALVASTHRDGYALLRSATRCNHRCHCGKLRIDTIRVAGADANFTQQVRSMELDHEPVDAASVGDSVGVQVSERAREHDSVYLVTSDSPSYRTIP
jgi:hypothetical protein